MVIMILLITAWHDHVCGVAAQPLIVVCTQCTNLISLVLCFSCLGKLGNITIHVI